MSTMLQFPQHYSSEQQRHLEEGEHRFQTRVGQTR